MTDLMNERATDYLGRLVEEVADHGDGTGTRTVYVYEGSSMTPASSSSSACDRPLPEPAQQSDSERIAILEEQVVELTALLAGEPT